MARKMLRLQRILKPVIRLIFRVFTRVKVVGTEHLPEHTPYIIFSNHISWFDPPLVGAFLPVPIHYMAMDSLFKLWPLGSVLRKAGAFPIKRRGIDRRAIECALDILTRGGVVCIFPEGGILRLMKGEKLRQGISLIAQCANVPLVPMSLSGCRDIYRFWNLILRRVVIQLRIGKPFLLSSVSSLKGKKLRQKSMKRIKREMYALSEEEIIL